MGDVIGPNSYLPGDIVALPRRSMCDQHPESPAVVRMVGETDSFGSELWDCCQECVDEMKNAPPHVGTCDWCKTPKVELRNMRDYEEGMHGRVYTVCTPCSDRYNKRQIEEFEKEYENEWWDPEC